MKTIGIIGCGNLANIIATGIEEKMSKYYTIIAVLDTIKEAADNLSKKCNCKGYVDFDEFIQNKPDYVIEAATPAVLKMYGEKILQYGSNLIPLSIGALADDDFYSNLVNEAIKSNRRVYLVSGAIGGMDLMRAATIYGNIKARIINRKAPKSLAGAPGVEKIKLSESEEMVVFEGNAKEAIKLFPKNVNVAVALAVSTVGVDKTNVIIISDPSVSNNIHTIELEGDFGNASIIISSKPSPDNPRSSQIAAISVLARLESLAFPISYF